MLFSHIRNLSGNLRWGSDARRLFRRQSFLKREPALSYEDNDCVATRHRCSSFTFADYNGNMSSQSQKLFNRSRDKNSADTAATEYVKPSCYDLIIIRENSI